MPKAVWSESILAVERKQSDQVALYAIFAGYSCQTDLRLVKSTLPNLEYEGVP